MAEVGQDGDDLIGGAESGDQRADGRALAQVVKQLELVEDTSRAGCDVDLLNGDVARFTTRRASRGVAGLGLEGRRRPL